MSNIFDALQRAELENSGAEGPSLALATELLQAAEQKLRDSGTLVEQPIVRRSISESPASVDDFDLATTAASEDWEQCPALSVAIQEEGRLVSLGKEGSLGAEKFRFLAVRLRQLRQTRPLKKVLITSTIPQEGKSTVAANLACTLARRKPQKTLLLEGDLRRPNITARFGLGQLPGLCEWLSGETSTINLYRLENLGIWILPAGSAASRPWKNPSCWAHW
jgi:Mrp family chromosome partitioning ATPase